MEPRKDRATVMADVPKGIERIAATVPKQYALLLLLDGTPTSR